MVATAAHREHRARQAAAETLQRQTSASTEAGARPPRLQPQLLLQARQAALLAAALTEVQAPTAGSSPVFENAENANCRVDGDAQIHDMQRLSWQYQARCSALLTEMPLSNNWSVCKMECAP